MTFSRIKDLVAAFSPRGNDVGASRADLQARIRELETRVNYDELTGCFSRSYFFETLRTRPCPGATLLFVDLDDFKSVNDHHGHTIGDELLHAIGAALLRHIGADGWVCRLAGDEFVVVLPERPGFDQAFETQNILDVVAQVSVTLGDLKISRSASVGGVYLEEAMTAQEALKLADMALATAKAAGKNQFSHVRDRRASLSGKRPSVDELRLGLQRGEVGYHLQPIFACQSRKIVGYEALLRWVRPSGEVLAPAQFLNTMTDAYNAQTKPPLEAARRVAEWATLTDGKWISFNISTEFMERVANGSLAWVSEIIGSAPQTSIVFELVETIVERETDKIAQAVAGLRDRGIRVALDDFGVGQSNLERLTGMMVDFVKVDRRFIVNAGKSRRDMDVLKTMIDMSHKLDAACVAEGIETEEDFQLVRDLGADFAQGFHLGRPAPLVDGALRDV